MSDQSIAPETTNLTSGWTCMNCGMYIASGQFHACNLQPQTTINYPLNYMVCVHDEWSDPYEWKDPYTHKTVLLQKCEKCNLARVVYVSRRSDE